MGALSCIHPLSLMTAKFGTFAARVAYKPCYTLPRQISTESVHHVTLRCETLAFDRIFNFNILSLKMLKLKIRSNLGVSHINGDMVEGRKDKVNLEFSKAYGRVFVQLWSSWQDLISTYRMSRQLSISWLNANVPLCVIWRRNRFQGTGSKVPEPVPKPGTRNRFLNIVSLTHCIICVLYESLVVNNESRNIDLKLMRLNFHFSFIHSFIYLPLPHSVWWKCRPTTLGASSN